MKAYFTLVSLHELELVVKPETEEECLMLAVFLKQDSMPLQGCAERRGDGRISEWRVRAEQP